MALSCIFCAADHEAKHAYDETMRSYKAPPAGLATVREATSSQERGSSESGRTAEGRRSNEAGMQLTNAEAQQRGRDSEERVKLRRSAERRSAERRSSERASSDRQEEVGKSREERISDEINRQMSSDSLSTVGSAWHVERMPSPIVESAFQRARPRIAPLPPVPDRPSLEVADASEHSA